MKIASIEVSDATKRAIADAIARLEHATSVQIALTPCLSSGIKQVKTVKNPTSIRQAPTK